MKKLLSIAALLFVFAQTVSAQITGTMVGTFTTPCNNNGAISVTVTGLIPPITYYYYGPSVITHSNVNSTSDLATGLPANLTGMPWSVVAIDAGKNYASGSFSLGSAFTGSVSVVTGTCPSPNTLQVVQLSGTGPYTFTWTNISTSQTFTGNPVTVGDGHYSVTVTHVASGCSASMLDSLSAFGVSPVQGSVTTTTANCTNGTATVIANGGVTPYTYQWHNNATTQSLSGLMQGMVSATVTDAQGCHAAFYAWVPQSVQLQFNATTNNATCLQNNGSALGFVTGGTAPYTYLWGNGATTSSLGNLTAGSYQLQITDAAGCIGTGGVYIQSSTPISVTYSSTASSCTAATGGATITPTGGVTPYTVVWSTFPTPSTGMSISNKPPGNYSFKVTDANGCVQQGVAVIAPVSTLNASLNPSPVICPATSGNIVAQVTGSSPPFTYAWNTSATTSSLVNVPLGAYSCTITDNVGCKLIKSETLQQFSPVVIGMVTTPVNCLYAANGAITAAATGGVGPYTYAWSNNQTGATVTGLTMGYYWVTATAANGCKDSQITYVGNSATSNNCYCTITGTVYSDTNNDCVRNSGENGIHNIQVQCSNIGFAYTNSNGVYSFQVPTGSYTITESIQMIHPLSSCQLNNQTVTVVAASNCSTTVNFANNTVPISDLHIINSSVIPPVPGNTYTQKVIVQNEGTLTESTIKLGYTHDGQLAYSSSIPWALSQQNSSSYPNWYSVAAGFPTLTPSNNSATFINYNVPTNIPLNTVVNFKDTVAKSSPIATSWLTDNTPWNNVDQFAAVVVSSYDPNFKEVSPAGFGSLGEITHADSVLTYIVHFQNEGTWFAQNVVVVDTLDANLNIKTLRPGYSDHKYVATIDKNNVLRFTFNNINLPYKSWYGDAMSSGMFVYSVRIKPKLPAGTKIRNSAAIYFDYNEPVITNKTLNTITIPAGINDQVRAGKNGRVLAIYPNPAKSEFHVAFQNEKDTKGTLTLFDISGRVVYSEAVQLKSGHNEIVIDKTNLQNGVYFVQLERSESVDVEKVVISK